MTRKRPLGCRHLRPDQDRLRLGQDQHRALELDRVLEGRKGQGTLLGADDVREGVAINHREGVALSITANSTNVTRFQRPLMGHFTPQPPKPP